MEKITFCVFMVVVLVTSLSYFAVAAPDKGEFFFGMGYGEASLNNDVYLYSDAGIDRQPELAPEESSQRDGTHYSVYVGQVMGTMKTNVLGSSGLNLAIQGGYTESVVTL